MNFIRLEEMGCYINVDFLKHIRIVHISNIYVKDVPEAKAIEIIFDQPLYGQVTNLRSAKHWTLVDETVNAMIATMTTISEALTSPKPEPDAEVVSNNKDDAVLYEFTDKADDTFDEENDVLPEVKRARIEIGINDGKPFQRAVAGMTVGQIRRNLLDETWTYACSLDKMSAYVNDKPVGEGFTVSVGCKLKFANREDDDNSADPPGCRQ